MGCLDVAVELLSITCTQAHVIVHVTIWLAIPSNRWCPGGYVYLSKIAICMGMTIPSPLQH